jgi:glycerol-3-phosphate dehydrogenase subunit C
LISCGHHIGEKVKNMEASCFKNDQTPQEILRRVMELCADCDTCRFLMDEDCAFFPELYRLWDGEKEGGQPVSEAQFRRLADLCTLCGLCPCPRIPIDVMEAKSRYIEREGLPLATRLLTDVPRLARLCGAFPRLVHTLQSSPTVGPLLRKAAGVHPERQLPAFSEENFFQWAAKKGLTVRREGRRHVAYFAGCTAGYLFPQLGRAVVEVLERSGATVHVPPQQCCGMPHLVEGDRRGALRRAGDNMATLLGSVRAGDELVSSCPTCGYFMRSLLLERAYYSEAYQESVNAGEDEIRIPDQDREKKRHKVLKKSIHKEILKDDGYFSSLDPMDRIGLSEHLLDAGEYLARLHALGRLNTRFDAIPKRMVYFAPCHQREQNRGRPYLDLLALIPELTVEPVGDSICCGMGGNFGFKAGFHETSLELGRPLMKKIRKLAPQAIVTDCMSCRLQFSHALPYPVFHPMEILARALQEGGSV